MDSSLGGRKSSPFYRDGGNGSAKMKQLYLHTEKILEENKARNKSIQDNIKDIKSTTLMPQFTINLLDYMSSSEQVSPRKPIVEQYNIKRTSSPLKKEGSSLQKLGNQSKRVAAANQLKKSPLIIQEKKNSIPPTQNLIQKIQNVPSASWAALRMIKQQNATRESQKARDTLKSAKEIDETPKFQKGENNQLSKRLKILSNEKGENGRETSLLASHAQIDGQQSCFSFGFEESQLTEQNFSKILHPQKIDSFQDLEQKYQKAVSFYKSSINIYPVNESHSHSAKTSQQKIASLNDSPNCNNSVQQIATKLSTSPPLNQSITRNFQNLSSVSSSQNIAQQEIQIQEDKFNLDDEPKRTLLEMRKKLVKGAQENSVDFESGVAGFIQSSTIKRASSQEYLLQEFEERISLEKIQEVMETQQSDDQTKQTYSPQKGMLTNNPAINQSHLKPSLFQNPPYECLIKEQQNDKNSGIFQIKKNNNFSLRESSSNYSNISSAATANSAHESIGFTSGVLDYQSRQISTSQFIDKQVNQVKNQINFEKIDLNTQEKQGKNIQLFQLPFENLNKKFDFNTWRSEEQRNEQSSLTSSSNQCYQIPFCPQPSPMPTFVNQFSSSLSNKGSRMASPSTSTQQFQSQSSASSASQLYKKCKHNKMDSSIILPQEHSKLCELQSDSSLGRKTISFGQNNLKQNEQYKKLDKLIKDQSQYYSNHSSHTSQNLNSQVSQTNSFKCISCQSSKTSLNNSKGTDSCQIKTHSKIQTKNVTPIKQTQITPSTSYSLKPSFTSNFYNSRNKGHLRSSLQTQQSSEAHFTPYQLPKQVNSFQQSLNSEKI